MSTRFVVSIAALVLLLGANIFLLGAENFEVRSTEEEKVIEDPLAGMRFEGKREANLKRIGLPTQAREKAVRTANRLDRQVGKRLATAMQKSERKAQLAEDPTEVLHFLEPIFEHPITRIHKRAFTPLGG